MNGRQQAAIDHLRMVGRDVHRFSSHALNYGLTAEQIRDAISEGVNQAEREEATWHATEQASESTCGPTPIGAN